MENTTGPESAANLEDCLPPDLRGPETTITRIAAGLSGAGVYRVDAAGQSFVLKIAGSSDPVAVWRGKLQIHRLAADAGLAPRIMHVDEELRAVLSLFVANRSFPALFGDPRTREAALTQLGLTVRRVHALPMPGDVPARDSRAMLAGLWAGPARAAALPAFVGAAVEGVLAETMPAPTGRPVLSHNDMNPSNLVYDGERLFLLDWDAAGLNDPSFDLATLALFFRMDEETSRRLLATYLGAPVAALPARFVYARRLIATLCGVMFLELARRTGHEESEDGETLSLAAFYQKMRAGEVGIATADGKFQFGLALVKEGLVILS